MDKLFKNMPEIISAAAQTPLGIFALLLILISGLAYCFFRKSSEKIKTFIWIILLVFGTGILALSVIWVMPNIGVPSTQKTEQINEAKDLDKPKPDSAKTHIEQHTKGDQSPAVIGKDVIIDYNSPKNKK